jgi:hypothetical protein
MALFPRTPKLESRNCPGLESWVGVPGLWDLMTPDYKVWSQRGLNQSCSSPWELSNALLHFRIRYREEVDFDPSFAHNLGCRCPNDQCEAILDIYVSRPFQWHQEHLNARCFGPCYRTLKSQESRRTSSPQLWECEFHPHTWPKWGCNTLPH